MSADRVDRPDDNRVIARGGAIVGAAGGTRGASGAAPWGRSGPGRCWASPPGPRGPGRGSRVGRPAASPRPDACPDLAHGAGAGAGRRPGDRLLSRDGAPPASGVPGALAAPPGAGAPGPARERGAVGRRRGGHGAAVPAGPAGVARGGARLAGLRVRDGGGARRNTRGHGGRYRCRGRRRGQGAPRRGCPGLDGGPRPPGAAPDGDGRPGAPRAGLRRRRRVGRPGGAPDGEREPGPAGGAGGRGPAAPLPRR